MKLPATHRFYTLNFLNYAILLKACTLFPASSFWFFENHAYLWLFATLITCITPLIIFIIIIGIPIELILRKSKRITTENIVILKPVTLKIIYFCVLFSTIYIFWYMLYYAPILEKQMQFD